ncbi:LytR/AlgR family response regulator transcription factor [Marinicella sediminis]|uniref:LytR/AlgR family response regulator transcription factor n=1 Tax=Marinicella sediminis TaxID=1792834 RepID=A0ABV7JBR3_9GAMM|nr:LytTR family DNA-binding domain-containing protein [Marinicella sediminis]
MMNSRIEISNRATVLGVISLCVMVVFFETAQQYFYVKTYDLSAEATFLDLFITQSRKWFIWLLSLTLVYRYMSRLAGQETIRVKDVLRVFVMISGCLLLVLLVMSLVEVLLNADRFSAAVYGSYFRFYVFQKTPIYMLGYLILAVVFYLFQLNRLLAFQILEFNQLEAKDKASYYSEHNNQSVDQQVSVLKIKVGNSHKIININDIDWIEADDYCVNVHVRNNRFVYTMRTSLKALEQVLPGDFMRVHRSAIVNMNAVEEYTSGGSGSIKLTTGDEIVIAKSKLKLVNEYFSYSSNGMEH